MEFEFERLAMKGEPCPKGLDVADTCAYMALKHLYAMYKERLIQRREASEEKRTIVYNHVQNKSMIDFLSRDALEKSQKIKEASEEYRENPTIENADKLYAAFYCLPDEWRSKTE